MNIVETQHDQDGNATFVQPRTPVAASGTTQFLYEHGTGPGSVRVGLETVAAGSERRLREFASLTQTVAVVLSGRLVVDDDLTVLSPGQALIQPGSDCAVSSADDTDCRVLLVTFVAEGEQTAALDEGPTDGVDGLRPRRVVVAGSLDHGAVIIEDREPPLSRRPAGDDRVVMTRYWETGGVLASTNAGGDVADEWQLGPSGGGACVDLIELDPRDYVAADEHWHATDTVDVDVIIDGQLELRLPDQDPVVLEPGDVVIQRGTNHQWVPLGSEVMRMVTVMIAVDADPRDPNGPVPSEG